MPMGSGSSQPSTAATVPSTGGGTDSLASYDGRRNPKPVENTTFNRRFANVVTVTPDEEKEGKYEIVSICKCWFLLDDVRVS